MENTTQLFLGVRFNCNKCHDHPFERWTQDQYYQTAAFFARTGLDRDPESGDRTIGGTAVPVLGAAALAQYPGMDQVNIGPLPRTLAGKGDSTLILKADQKTANSVTVSIK